MPKRRDPYDTAIAPSDVRRMCLEKGFFGTKNQARDNAARNKRGPAPLQVPALRRLAPHAPLDRPVVHHPQGHQREGFEMIKKRSRDWFRILRDLMKAGTSMRQIARACGREVRTVSHWGDGGEPKDSDARVVLALYKRHCPEEYRKHMEEFEGDVLQFQREVVYVKPDHGIRGRPAPKAVAVTRSPQFDFFVQEPA